MQLTFYEWMAAITLVFVAIFFLPKFLRSGIFTIPEYLEYRYNLTARTLMAFYTMLIYVGVTIAAVVYSGALALSTIFEIDLIKAIWLVGSIAAVYTIWGGLKAVVWADLFQGSALILGGAITMVLGFIAVGGVGNFFETNADKLHMILPSDHPVLPWTALVVGLWIPNFYYWGLNQYITQRTLAAKTLKQGQLGVIFAAFLKLLIPSPSLRSSAASLPRNWRIRSSKASTTTFKSFKVFSRQACWRHSCSDFSCLARPRAPALQRWCFARSCMDSF